jgi:hypothetical protein
LLAKHEGKRTLRIQRQKRWDNIKMNLKELGCKGVDWIHVGQERVKKSALINMASIKRGQFLDELVDHQPLKDSAPLTKPFSSSSK